MSQGDNMFKSLYRPFQAMHQQLIKLPWLWHTLAAIVSFGLLGFTNTILEASYATSQYPVSYAAGQTTFNGELLKSYYAFMLEKGTFDLYWRTQFIDFTFIAAVFAAGLLIPTVIRRAARPSTLAYIVLTVAAVIIPLGAILDVIENLISFVIISQPLTFPNWLALPYSTVAVMKFVCMGGGMIILLIGVVLLIIQRLVQLGSSMLGQTVAA